MNGPWNFNQWTFGKKVAAGFALSFALLTAIGAVALKGTSSLMLTSDWVAHSHTVIEHIEAVTSFLKDAETGQRGFVITGDSAYLEPYQNAGPEIARLLKELHQILSDDPQQQKRLDDAEPIIAAKLLELKKTIEMREHSSFEVTEKFIARNEGKVYMDNLRRIFGDMEHGERSLLKQRAAEANATAVGTRTAIIAGTLLCLLLLIAAGFFITRSLARQIGSAVQHIQSSSTELQSAASQQASGSKEQVSAMSEITVTVKELLATAKQIAESAQRVAKIAEDTATAAHMGDQTVQKGQDVIAGIKRQVDLIVAHMLDLGKKSQQIGGILEIINELADQTNILSINATIEAAGAGELGKRFAAVADEIRKLADRVGSSTKEIRTLIDEVRGAVHTTVMATESGSKAVEAGTQQFGEVASAFKQIAGLVGTTTEAAKEIELSTKQQSNAVEQVTIATTNVAQAAKEAEASSSQTVQTASDLAKLSHALALLIQPQARA